MFYAKHALCRVVSLPGSRNRLRCAPVVEPPSSLARAWHERALTRIGSTLREKYTIDRLLGVGGMAAVYAATHRNAKRFAIKLLHADLSLNPELRHRFLREGYLANSVGHPGAVSVLDDDVGEDGSAFLVMELLDGETVAALQARCGPLAPGAALAIAEGVLDVLIAAHARAIVHRDIKPANLFVTRSGGVKVLDFGVARMRDPASGLQSQSGLAIGTPAFMAPEQALGSDAIDGRTDVWAVGATLFTLLSGRPVHDAPPAMSLMWAATRPAAPIGSLRADLPAGIVDLVDRALAFDRADRWPTAMAMRDAVRAELAGAGSASVRSLLEGAEVPPPSLPTVRVGGVVVSDRPPPPSPPGVVERPEATPFVATSTAQPRTNRTRQLLAAAMVFAAAIAAASLLSRPAGPGPLPSPVAASISRPLEAAGTSSAPLPAPAPSEAVSSLASSPPPTESSAPSSPARPAPLRPIPVPTRPPPLPGPTRPSDPFYHQ